MMLRTAHLYQAGYMQPTGRVFETPDLFLQMQKALF